MSRPSRRQVQAYQLPAPSVYSSVPQSSPPRRNSVQSPYHYQSSVGGPRPVVHGRVQSTSSNGHHYSNSQSHAARTSTERRPSYRNGVTMGVATGQIGSAYGPYSYHTNPPPRNAGVYGTGRFSNTPSENSLSTQEHSGQQHQQSPWHSQPLPQPQAPLPQRTTTVPMYMWDKEPDMDDALHTPDPRRDNSCTPFSWRGWVNVVGILVLLSGLLTLFIGFPVIDYARSRYQKIHGFNLGGVNGTGQVPTFPGMPRLIDPDTPREAFTRTGHDGHKYNLVFSDEFNVDGRTFYPGDDPYWEAVDMHYWPTGNLEWYDPGQVTTENGKLVITFDQKINHDLNFISGMVTTWNKVCFTTGYIEVSVSLPGSPSVPGLWPAAWTMGNLGRAGYGASTEGMWPYSYDTCDLGTLQFQRGPDGQPGDDVLTYGPNRLSMLPGQRLSACTCPGSDHPGPRHDVGRAAPEVDIFEAEVDSNRGVGQVSQSFQIAPFDADYNVTESFITIYDENVSHRNRWYKGGPYQQAVSVVSDVPSEMYDDAGYSVYGYELWSDPDHRDQGYITWFSNGLPTWTVTPGAIGPDSITQISERLISEEPMYMILNVGMAENFEEPDYANLKFPAKMRVDYFRIYQREGVRDGLTCNPPKRPTTNYINKHMNAYTNPDLTIWANASYTFPRNRIVDGC